MKFLFTLMLFLILTTPNFTQKKIINLWDHIPTEEKEVTTIDGIKK